MRNKHITEYFGHHTVKGRVVYKRPRHIFSGRDMTRIVTAVNNNQTGSDVNWLYVAKLAWQNTAHLHKTELTILKESDHDRFYKNLLALGDFIHKYITPIVEKVPVAGGLVTIADSVYSWVREYYGD